MRANFLAALALAVFFARPACAQAPLPKCAATCFQSALQNQTTCLPTDTPCICQNEPLNQAIQGCVMTTCTVKESLSTINSTMAMCGIPYRDRTQGLIITNLVFGPLALLSLGVRLHVSLRQHIFGIDDICAIIAWVFSAPITYGQVVCGYLGFGKDTWAVPPENIYKVLLIVYANELCYFVSAVASKLCFCFIFLRIFPAQRTRKMVFVGMVLSGIYIIAFGVPQIVFCKPISAAWTGWDGETPNMRCLNQNIFWFVAAGYNIAVDIYILLIPIPDLLKLTLNRRKKFMLIAIFSTGIVTIIVSIARLWALTHYGHSTNPLYDNVLAGIFSPLELNVGIIAMCMPAFRRFVVRLLPGGSNDDDGGVGMKGKYREHEDSTSNAQGSSGKRSGNKRPDTLGGSLFQTSIMKTVDTRVESTGPEEDEVRLMELRKNGKAASSTDDLSQQQQQQQQDLPPTPPSESLYKIRHKNTLPKEW